MPPPITRSALKDAFKEALKEHKNIKRLSGLTGIKVSRLYEFNSRNVLSDENEEVLAAWLMENGFISPSKPQDRSTTRSVEEDPTLGVSPLQILMQEIDLLPRIIKSSGYSPIDKAARVRVTIESLHRNLDRICHEIEEGE